MKGNDKVMTCIKIFLIYPSEIDNESSVAYSSSANVHSENYLVLLLFSFMFFFQQSTKSDTQYYTKQLFES